MKTYSITLTCTDPSEIEIRELETQEPGAKEQAAIRLLEAIFKSQGKKGAKK